MRTIDTLRAEHDGILAVLAHLERAVAAAERGVAIPVDVFADIQEFFTIFVDRCHHGKEEDEVFSRLERDDKKEVPERLGAEHETGRKLAAAYAGAVRGYVPGDVASGMRLAQAARAYDRFLRNHIEEENRELFPLIEQMLATEDQALVEAFDRIEEERIGPGTHERLHHMIDGLPQRIDPFVTA